MYELVIASVKVEKRINEYLSSREDIKDKLVRLKDDPRRANGAHPLHGKLNGKWACWLGSNIRLIYEIDDLNKMIKIYAIGSHKVY